MELTNRCKRPFCSSTFLFCNILLTRGFVTVAVGYDFPYYRRVIIRYKCFRNDVALNYIIVNISKRSSKPERNWKSCNFVSNFCLKRSSNGIYIFGTLQNIYNNIDNVRTT